MRWSFELEFDLNRPHSPTCPTFPGQLETKVIHDSGKAGRTRRRDLTIDFDELSRADVEHVLENPQHLPPKAGAPLFITEGCAEH